MTFTEYEKKKMWNLFSTFVPWLESNDSNFHEVHIWALFFHTATNRWLVSPSSNIIRGFSPLWSINRGSDLVQFIVSKSSSEFCGQLKLDCWKTTNIIIASCNYSGLQFGETRHYKLLKYPMNWTISYVYLRSFIST